MATQSTNKPKQTTSKTKATNKPKATTKPKEKELKSNVIDITDDGKNDKFEIEAKPEGKKPPAKGKPRGGKSPVIGDNGIKTEPGDNSKYATILLELSSWPKPDKRNVEELEDRFMEYLQYCAINDVKIGNQMAYLAMGLNKDDVYDMEHGRKLDSTHSDFIKKVKQICAGNRELLMQDGKVNPITGIFWQKNYDQMKDVQDITITPNNQLQPTMSLDQIAEKVKADVVIDVDDE